MVVLVGGIFGAVNPLVRYALALIPIVMGLNLLGIINIKAPGLQKWRPVRAGTLGAFLTGLLFSLVILPCATPVLASILSYATGRGNAQPIAATSSPSVQGKSAFYLFHDPSDQDEGCRRIYAFADRAEREFSSRLEVKRPDVKERKKHR